MDRRAVFFLCAALAATALIPLTPSKFTFVGVILAIAYVVLAVLSALDYRSRHGGFGRQR